MLYYIRNKKIKLKGIVKMIYKDKNGNKILAGMTLQNEIDGDKEKVYLTVDGKLGFNASNESYLKHYPDHNREVYLLSEFDLSEWAIVSE